MIVIIHSRSRAWRALRQALTNPDVRKISLEIREDGLAIKVNELMWSLPLESEERIDE